MVDVELLALAGVRVIEAPGLPKACIYVRAHRIGLLDSLVTPEERGRALAWLLDQALSGSLECLQSQPRDTRHRP